MSLQDWEELCYFVQTGTSDLVHPSLALNHNLVCIGLFLNPRSLLLPIILVLFFSFKKDFLNQLLRGLSVIGGGVWKLARSFDQTLVTLVFRSVPISGIQQKFSAFLLSLTFFFSLVLISCALHLTKKVTGATLWVASLKNLKSTTNILDLKGSNLLWAFLQPKKKNSR